MSEGRKNGKSQPMLLIVLIWAMSCWAANASAAPLVFTDVSYKHRVTGNIQVVSLREASGLAYSPSYPNVLWSHNDSGYGPQLFALDIGGELRGRYYLKQATSRDWEDIASFEWQGKSWLAIADTGNNSARDLATYIHLVAEPEVNDEVINGRRVNALIADYSLKFVFPDGPADCEAIAVDAKEERIYLLTKRQVPPRLYSLALPDEGHDASQVIKATFEGQIATIPKPSLQELIDYPTFGLHRSQPTAMDFSPDGTFVIINTYGYAYLFPRLPGQAWIQVLNSQAQRISVPFRKQGEAVAVGQDGQSLFFTSEGTKPPIFQLNPKSSVPVTSPKMDEEEGSTVEPKPKNNL